MQIESRKALHTFTQSISTTSSPHSTPTTPTLDPHSWTPCFDLPLHLGYHACLHMMSEEPRNLGGSVHFQLATSRE